MINEAPELPPGPDGLDSALGDSSQGDDADLMIVSQVAAGQKDLFRLLVRRHERAVYGMGLSFFRNAEDASDFTQEVFLKVYRNLSRFEGRSRFSTWLYKIAYNTAVNGVNRRKEYQSLAGEEGRENPAGPQPRDEDTPERLLLRKAAQEAVLEALKELPERYRICVDMFFFYDRSYQEIEAITGFPVNTIKSHVFRAKKLLREKLTGIAEKD
ncbi:MAG: sigma-70 family RNA polymerase sigma factor [Treponema sp.]|jgi:RNA polymerase sigma-70 factor (ECF subfamily)|nr:sigma-70 family RNA polymerase sigma factor [Treponema sp.]